MASDGFAPVKAYGTLVATMTVPPTEISVIVTISLDPPSGIVSVGIKDESVAMLELEATVVVDVPGATLELEATVVVDVPVALPGGSGLELGVAGGTVGNVVFRAGHPEDPASRRTGQ